MWTIFKVLVEFITILLLFYVFFFFFFGATWHVGFQLLTRGWKHAPCVGRQSLHHWTTREVLCYFLLIKNNIEHKKLRLVLCDDQEQWDGEQVGGRTKREGIHVCCCFVPQSCLTLCYPMDCSPPGSSVHGSSHGQEYWSGLPFPSLGDLPDPGIEPRSPALTGRFFTTEPPGKPRYMYMYI